MKAYHAARLEYGIRKSDGNYRQSHNCGHNHKNIKSATICAIKMQQRLNCVDVVDETGKMVPWDNPNTYPIA